MKKCENEKLVAKLKKKQPRIETSHEKSKMPLDLLRKNI
jgi:hypothetical protein